MKGVRLFLVFGAPIFSALVLIYLLLPGTLVSATELDVRDTGAIEERLRRLRDYAAQDVCEAPKEPPTIVPPGSETDTDRVFRPVPVDPETTEVPAAVAKSASQPARGADTGDAGSGEAGETAAEAAGTNGAGEPPTDSQPRSLADLIRESTLLILALGEDESGIGTGFVVDDRHVVTNYHVVDGASTLLATSRTSGRMMEFELVASVEGDVLGGVADLALLRAREPLGLARLPVVPFPNEMDGVFAAGYPGFVVAMDQGFRDLIAGDMESAPSIVITQGRISTIQNRDGTSPLVVHSAEISQGNSGGPLIDECGRVVGINTLGRTDLENDAKRTVFYAQPTQMALKAFADTGADFHVIEGYCGTVTAKDVSPPASGTPVSE